MPQTVTSMRSEARQLLQSLGAREETAEEVVRHLPLDVVARLVSDLEPESDEPKPF